MSSITFKGTTVHSIGELPSIGSSAPDFSLVSTTLERVSLDHFGNAKKILNIFPSIDTRTCSKSVHSFESKISKDVFMLHISRDTPFALSRFSCEHAESNPKSFRLSDLSHDFGKAYGVELTDGPLAHLLSRAVIILSENNTVLYTEQVPEISQEPDYEKALTAL